MDHYFQHTPDLICVANAQGQIHEVNPAFRETLGYSEEQLGEFELLDLIYPDDRERTATVLREVYDGAKNRRFESRLIGRDGAVHMLDWCVSYSPDVEQLYASGRMIGNHEPDSPMEGNEAAHWGAIVDRLPQLICAFDHQGNLIHWNRICELVTGFSALEVRAQECALQFLLGRFESGGASSKAWIEETSQRSPLSWVFRSKETGLRSINWDRFHAKDARGRELLWLVGAEASTDQGISAGALENSELFSLILNHGNIGFILLDDNMNVYFTSSKLPPYFQILHEQNQSGATMGDSDAAAGSGLLHRMAEQRKSGTLLSYRDHDRESGSWYEISIDSLNDGLAVVYHDVTEDILAREGLTGKDQILRAVFDALPVWISVKDRQGRYIMVNRKTLEDNGLKESDYLGTHTLDLPFGTKEEMRRNWEVDKTIIATGKKVVVERHPHTMHDGKMRAYHYSKVPFHDDSDEVAGIVTVSMDITEMNEALEKLRDKEANLLLAQEMAHLGYWDWNITTGDLSWTDEIYRIFGLAPQQFGATYEAFLEYVHPDDRQDLSDAVNGAVEQGHKYQIEHRVVRPDGSIRRVIEHGRVFRDEYGTPLRMLGAVHDLTEVKHVEMELASYTEKLMRSNQELENFASIASHDLQEPLRKVIAFSERLKLKAAAELSEDNLFYLERIQDASSRMRALVEDLLTFSRVSTKGRPFVPVDLNVVVDGVLSDLEIQIQENGAEVEILSLPTLDADELQMRQLFQNLISNSLKYRREEINPVIRISSEPAKTAAEGSGKESCTIVVADNGIGFDQKYAERIFTIFRRLHGRGEYSGNGIGLAVCRKIVERHDGTIQSHGVPNEGASFLITLPLKHDSSQGR